MALWIPVLLCSIICFFNVSLCVLLLQNTSDTPFPMIFQFGDSLSDTGNKITAFPNCAKSKEYQKPPYGMTYFKQPSKRVCDGRLTIDFIASGLGLPFLNPYLVKSNFTNGVNFAVAGATAGSLDNYRHHNVITSDTFSFDTQLSWFLEFKSQFGGSPSMLRDALYVVGEIGGNDYAALWKAGWSTESIERFVGAVVNAIEDLSRSLYAAGARKFLMVNLPLQGCNPLQLVRFRLPGDEYDEFGCILRMRELGELHNLVFDSMYRKLETELEDAEFWYGDYYGTVIKVMRNPENYGIENLLKACCGIYTNSINVACGDNTTVNNKLYVGTACDDPSVFVFWNEGHFTERFNEIVANDFLAALGFAKTQTSEYRKLLSLTSV